MFNLSEFFIEININVKKRNIFKDVCLYFIMTYLIDRFLINGEESWAILKTILGRILEEINDPELAAECTYFRSLPHSRERIAAEEKFMSKIKKIRSHLTEFYVHFKPEYQSASLEPFYKIFDMLIDVNEYNFDTTKTKINDRIAQIFEDYEG